MKNSDYLHQSFFSIDPNQKYNILIISSFPTRECGIATFSKDLLESIQGQFHQSVTLDVCAIDQSDSRRHYPKPVQYILHADQSSSYSDLADALNIEKKYDCILLEHEFGLFQGNYGSMLMHFLERIEIPILTTFHTVLPDPSAERKHIVSMIIQYSKEIICMTNASGQILKNYYDCPIDKITIIPHGTHLPPFKSTKQLKSNFGFPGRKTLATFGLLSSGKGIETALHAIAKIRHSHPELLYLIIGKTHPEVIKHEGEKYRNFLNTLITELGIESHVSFVNEFVDRKTLQEYLQATDIYLFTSTDPHQAVSGTFSYAMGCGCPIISTRIPQAEDMLGSAGILVDFNDSKQMSKAIQSLFNDDSRLKHMKRNALQQIRPSAWQNVAIQHMKIIEEHGLKNVKSLQYTVPNYNLSHFFHTTNDIGMVQFCQGDKPQQATGYTLDDNARAMISLMEYYELKGDSSVLALIDIHFAFIRDIQQENGSFLNYRDSKGELSAQNFKENLDDSNGRAIWAIGTMISKHHLFEGDYVQQIQKMLVKALPKINSMRAPRSISFCIKGLTKYNEVYRDREIDQLISKLGQKLTVLYDKNKINAHHWFEPTLTYANAVIPEALLLAYRNTGNERFKLIAKESFDYLCSLLFQVKHFRVISNQTWYDPTKVNSEIGEQPIDVAYTIIALKEFYETFGLKRYLKQIKIAFDWYLGKNQLHQIVYNPITGGCLDGLEEKQVNMNQGAEATTTYLMARNRMEQLHIQELQQTNIFTKQKQTYIKNTPYAQDRNFQSTKS